ncbi:hypothetical protein C8A05DRAFT_36106 [Staphylotrichum tortipilum]|uniref:CSN8/PSMD8/EIF3K domain-containing protein n=1 Tax=Staphylotrichum tortipilum TaxID=2831512 RepID=A0AAN6MHF1_9PEZI|nr:hypothetical protein C8A05DRAFT_36106 [Staphylotrichum longicolle]
MQRKPRRIPSGRLSRLKPVELDPLAEYGLPSKGEKRLLSPKVQESYYSKIVARYLAFCTQAGDRAGLERQFAQLSLNVNNTNTNATSSPLLPPPPSQLGFAPTSASALASASSSNQQHLPFPRSNSADADATPNQDSDTLAQILSALRKLREGLVASHRHDHFATQVYFFSVRLGILASAYETYYPSLLHLLALHERHLSSPPPTTNPDPKKKNYPTPPTPTTPSSSSSAPLPPGALTPVEHHEAASYLILDAACRRGDLATAYALRSTHKLRDNKIDAVLAALAADNWVAWRRVRGSVDGYRARLLDCAERRVRGHTLKAFGRAYLSLPLGVLEGQTGCTWGELREGFGVGWELEEGGRVVIRRVQGR